MADDVPSPAAPRAVQAEPSERHGLSRLPWEQALYAAVSNLEAQLDACRKENAELHVSVAQLNARLRRAREAQERWKLRREAWTRERNELLTRLDDERRRG